MSSDINTFESQTWAKRTRFLFSNPAHMIGLGFGVGLIPIAPGTFGTALAFPLFYLLYPQFQQISGILLLIVIIVLGVFVADICGKNIKNPDSRFIVCDETIAFLLVLVFTPPSIKWQGLAFLLFRFFDIFKPYPIYLIDKNLKNGVGVMLDDLVAAYYTLLCVSILTFILV